MTLNKNFIYIYKLEKVQSLKTEQNKEAKKNKKNGCASKV